MPTALQIAQVRQTPFSAGLIMAIQDAHPLFSSFDFRTVDGYDFLSLALIARPNAASFARYGEGWDHTSAAFELRRFSTSLIGGIVKSELITEERWNQENAAAEWDWFDIETEEKFKASIMDLERQMILGRFHNAEGFPGALELTPFEAGNVITMTENGAKYNYRRSVLNAGGSTDQTASSVYSFVFGEKQCQGIIGGGATSGEFLRIGEDRIQMLAPNAAEPTKLSEHRVAQMSGHIGLSVAGFNQESEGQVIPVQYAIRRLANLTEQTGFKLTDAHMTKLSRMHGTGLKPSLYAMSERSGEQLAASRAATALNFVMGMSGDAATNTFNTHPEPPDNWRGTPIVYVDPSVIADDDAIEV